MQKQHTQRLVMLFMLGCGIVNGAAAGMLLNNGQFIGAAVMGCLTLALLATLAGLRPRLRSVRDRSRTHGQNPVGH